MDRYVEDLVRLRVEAANRMKEIYRNAESRPDGERELTAEERANIEKFDADYDRYAAEEKRVVDQKNKIGPAADALAEAIERNREDEKKNAARGFSFNAFMGSTGDNEQRHFWTARTLPLGAESNNPLIRDVQARAMEERALQSAGGSAVETSFANFVAVYERTLNPVINVATVIATSTGSPIVVPRLTADPVTSGTVTAEAAGITEADPTISSITLVAYKRAITTLWSAELDQDEIIGLDQLVARSIGRKVGLDWGTAFTSGNDTNEANGYVTAIGTVSQRGTALGTANGVATDTFFSPADLVDQFYLLAAPYRANATWLVATTALAKMRKFRDSTGQFLWSPALQAGEPETFLNRPVFENPALAAVASASVSVTVGDFSAYYVRDVQPVRVDRSIEYKFNTDQVAIRYITRRDGDMADTIAIRSIQSANT